MYKGMHKWIVLLAKVSALSLLAHSAQAQMRSTVTTTNTYDFPDQFAPSTTDVRRTSSTWSCGDGGGDGDGNSGDPLIFDLQGDGIVTLSIDAGVMFDMDNDGILDRTAWVGPDDALLVVDHNGDGKINNHSELFGTEVMGGISDLSRYDSNSDGVIDEDDTIWPDLMLWRDRNSNARSHSSEFLTLEEVKITSISLEGVIRNEEREDATIIGTGSATRERGPVMRIYDVIFFYISEAAERAAEAARRAAEAARRLADDFFGMFRD